MPPALRYPLFLARHCALSRPVKKTIESVPTWSSAAFAFESAVGSTAIHLKNSSSVLQLGAPTAAGFCVAGDVSICVQINSAAGTLDVPFVVELHMKDTAHTPWKVTLGGGVRQFAVTGYHIHVPLPAMIPGWHELIIHLPSLAEYCHTEAEGGGTSKDKRPASSGGSSVTGISTKRQVGPRNFTSLQRVYVRAQCKVRCMFLCYEPSAPPARLLRIPPFVGGDMSRPAGGMMMETHVPPLATRKSTAGVGGSSEATALPSHSEPVPAPEVTACVFKSAHSPAASGSWPAAARPRPSSSSSYRHDMGDDTSVGGESDSYDSTAPSGGSCVRTMPVGDTSGGSAFHPLTTNIPLPPVTSGGGSLGAALKAQGSTATHKPHHDGNPLRAPAVRQSVHAQARVSAAGDDPTVHSAAANTRPASSSGSRHGQSGCAPLLEFVSRCVSSSAMRPTHPSSLNHNPWDTHFHFSGSSGRGNTVTGLTVTTHARIDARRDECKCREAPQEPLTSSSSSGDDCNFTYELSSPIEESGVETPPLCGAGGGDTQDTRDESFTEGTRASCADACSEAGSCSSEGAVSNATPSSCSVNHLRREDATCGAARKASPTPEWHSHTRLVDTARVTGQPHAEAAVQPIQAATAMHTTLPPHALSLRVVDSSSNQCSFDVDASQVGGAASTTHKAVRYATAAATEWETEAVGAPVPPTWRAHIFSQLDGINHTLDTALAQLTRVA